jgi:hypothetical protein
MADIDLKTETPDTTLPTTGFLFGADSQAAASPSVYSTQAVATTLLGSTSLTGATVTTSQPLLDQTQTWNAGGVTFTGWRLNVTNTASAAGSLLMDLQVGGASQFSVNRSGSVTSNNLVSGGGALAVSSSNGQVVLYNNGTLGWDSAGSVSVGSAADTLFGRRAAANLRLGAADAAAPVAQTLSVQSVVAGTSNTAGANFTIAGSQGTGDQNGGSLIFQVAPAGSSGSAVNALATALTIAGNRNATFAANLSFGSGADFSNGTGTVNINDSNVGIGSASQLAWASTTTGNGSKDVILARDAANTLALRNGTAAQTFNNYGTFTDTSNYRRVALSMTTAGVATLQPEGAGTGASGNVLHISGLPTSNPGPGILWNNAGTPAIGT